MYCFWERVYGESKAVRALVNKISDAYDGTHTCTHTCAHPFFFKSKHYSSARDDVKNLSKRMPGTLNGLSCWCHLCLQLCSVFIHRRVHWVSDLCFFSTTKWLTQLRHCLPGDGIRSHKLRVQFHKTVRQSLAPPPFQTPISRSGCGLWFWPTGSNWRFPQTPPQVWLIC